MTVDACDLKKNELRTERIKIVTKRCQYIFDIRTYGIQKISK